MTAVLSCKTGGNEDIFPDVLAVHVPEGARIADVTYGKGVFWKNVPANKYEIVGSDLSTGTDFRKLPYDDHTFDALVLDPPYMPGGGTVKASINNCYRNEHNPLFSYEAVVANYVAGILEARRVLKRKGILIVKCQPQVYGGKQRLAHVDLMTIMRLIGFVVEDEFVLHASATPAQDPKWTQQYHARKNHSYFIVARFMQ